MLSVKVHVPNLSSNVIPLKLSDIGRATALNKVILIYVYAYLLIYYEAACRWQGKLSVLLSLDKTISHHNLQ